MWARTLSTSASVVEWRTRYNSEPLVCLFRMLLNIRFSVIHEAELSHAAGSAESWSVSASQPYIVNPAVPAPAAHVACGWAGDAPLHSLGDLDAMQSPQERSWTCDFPSARELICNFGRHVDERDAIADDSCLVSAQMLIQHEWNLSRRALRSTARPPHQGQSSAVNIWGNDWTWIKNTGKNNRLQHKHLLFVALLGPSEGQLQPCLLTPATGPSSCWNLSNINCSSTQEPAVKKRWSGPAASCGLHICFWRGPC